MIFLDHLLEPSVLLGPTALATLQPGVIAPAGYSSETTHEAYFVPVAAALD